VARARWAAVSASTTDLVVSACAEASAEGDGGGGCRNFNSPGQVVIAGDAAAVTGDRALRRAGRAPRAAAAGVGPFHCR